MASAPANVRRWVGGSCTGRVKEDDEEEEEGEEQAHTGTGPAQRPSPAGSSTPDGQHNGGTATLSSGGADDQKECGKDAGVTQHHGSSGSTRSSSKKGRGVIGAAAAAPPASQPNVKVAVAGLWLSVRRSECFGLLVRVLKCWCTSSIVQIVALGAAGALQALPACTFECLGRATNQSQCPGYRNGCSCLCAYPSVLGCLLVRALNRSCAALSLEACWCSFKSKRPNESGRQAARTDLRQHVLDSGMC